MLLTRRYRPKPVVISPIMHAETLHLQRAARGASVPRRLVWLGRAGWVTGLIYMASVLLAIVIGAILNVPATTWWRSSFNLQSVVYGWVENAQVVILLLLFIDHFTFGFAVLQMAASAIARERGAGTYDLLRLTLCSPRQIVRGKWRAVFPLYVAPSVRIFAYRIMLSLLLGLCLAFQSRWQSPSLLLLSLIIWAVPMLRFVCGLYLAAVGIMVSAFMRSEAAAVRIAFGLLVGLQLVQLITVVAVSVFSYNIRYDDVIPLWREMSALLGNNVFVPLTGGFSVVIVVYEGETLLHSVARLIAALIVAGIVYGGLTWLALRLAEWRLARG